ncbi:MAG TPA: SUMF1/EgtB/PvdO family nonheme iron enzyme, partial [Terriglobus sp.]
AVIYVSWHDAVAYCQWLSKREGKHYRLPTEAEWEYAARAGTSTLFATGNTLPDYYLKNAVVTDFNTPKDKVSLRVGQTPANPWGLYDMHGNVEEWVQDWYAPQASHEGGPADGTFKVTRGGSHGTFAYYLRSANRAAALPETRGFTIGFRVACAEPLVLSTSSAAPVEVVRAKVTERPVRDVMLGPDPSKPYFIGPMPFVKIPDGASGPLYSWHNHDTALTECPNGDLLAAWYTCAREQGRELSVACSRLAFGEHEWSEASSFYDTPDRNDHCPGLWFDGDQTMYHLNGTALSHYWEPLQIVLRESKDSGVTWSKPRYIAQDFGLRNMVCQPIFVLKNGWWAFGADAHPQGSALWLSKDRGATWECTEGTINGIHAAIVELNDGRLMALGRGANVDGHLPMSISDDYGKTWKAHASELPPITYTQRFAMTRLKEGSLVLVTFLPDISRLGSQQATDRELAKLCICVSYDEGKTWPVRRVLSNETGDRGITGMSNGRVYLGPGYGEPTAYCSIVQARNGVIHVLSSMNHYAFNLKWVEAAPHWPDAMPKPVELPLKDTLSTSLSMTQMEAHRVSRTLWTNERTGAMDALDLTKGFSVEASVELRRAEDDYFILRAFARSGCTMCNRYWLRVRPNGVDYWYAGAWQPLKEAYGSGGSERTYRMSVRNDTCVQIYEGARVVGTYPASYEIGFAPPTRGNWMEWECPAEPVTTQPKISFDLLGAFRKG